MATIDNRVVEMNFDNSKFGAGVDKTLGMLERLKTSLHLNGASKGLQDINTAAQNFNGAPMEQGVGRIAGSFTAMQAVAFGALANVGSMISSTAINMAKSFTLDPLVAGFQEYELKMGSIQTILANTQRHGTTLETVNGSLEELNEYADQTIYNFGDMTKNIGLFTNAGIKVEDATTMIKGFSNAAASSGTSAEGAAGAAYQLSQALSAGKVTLMDWRSLQNVGMGNKNMQQGIIDIAKAMGTMEDAGVTASEVQGDFNGSLETGWLTADVMSTYMKAMSGDMDDAALASLGLTDAQVALLRQQATTGLEAATKVRTFTQLMSTMRESVGSGWSETFGLVFGDFEEATELFTGINNAVGGFVGRMSDSRNELLKSWKDMGGRTVLIEGLKEAFWAIGAPLAQIGKAFREVFPPMTAERLMAITTGFRDFMLEIQPSPETLDRLRRTFAGLFAILGIGWEVIKAVAKFLGDLFLGLGDGDSGILRFTASIGDFLVALHKSIKSGEGLTKFFDQLRDGIFKILNPIRDAGRWIGELFEGAELGPAGNKLGEFVDNLLTLGDTAKKSVSLWDRLKKIVKDIFDFFSDIAEEVSDFLEPVTDKIKDAFDEIDFDQVMSGFQTAGIAGIALFIKQLGGMFKGFSLFQNDAGFFDSIKEGLDGLSGTLGAMQANLKASMLLKIAAAIALLAISVVLLAGVDAQGLLRATTALTAMFIQLGAAMYAFQKIGTVASMAKLSLMGAALILIATAILILTVAVKSLAALSWEELGKGLSALVVLMGVIIGLSRGLDKARGAIIRSALALNIMAVALRMLVWVVKVLGAIDLKTMAKGLGGVAALLLALGLFSRLQKTGPGAIAQAASIMILAYALGELAKVIKVFGQMSWEEMGKGFAALATGLLVIAGAMRLMPAGPSMLLTAFGIAKIAGAFGLMALAFKQFNDISWEVIARGLTAIAGTLGALTVALKLMPKVGVMQTVGLLLLAASIKVIVDAMIDMASLNWQELGKAGASLAGILAILAAGMKGMTGSLVGAAAMLVMAAALRVLVPVITTLGTLPIPVIAIALGALAAVFAVLGIAAWLLAPVVPVLMALGIAIGLIGAAMALAGAGIFLFSLALTGLAAAGAAGAAAIIAIVSGLVGLIPMVMEQIGLGIVAFANVIATSGPAIVEAITTVLTSLLDAIINVIPKLMETLDKMLTAMISFLYKNVPRLIKLGFDMLMALLNGIANNIGRIVDKATDIIVNFVNGLIRNLPRLIQAGIDLVIAFIRGIGDGIRKNGPAIADAAWDMVTGLVDGIVNGILSLGGKLLDALWDMVSAAWDGVLDFFGINSPSTEGIWLGRMIDQGIANGLTKYSHVAENAAVDMGDNVLTSMTKTISGLGNMISGEMDMRPVIAPVLDLTDVRKSAAGIGTLLEAPPLNVGASYSGAANASAGYLSNLAALEAEAAATEGEGITFVQNNYSPKAISPAETYRNTRSQLSIAKEALKTNAD